MGGNETAARNPERDKIQYLHNSNAFSEHMRKVGSPKALPDVDQRLEPLHSNLSL